MTTIFLKITATAQPTIKKLWDITEIILPYD
jgi:hypothetical protein